VSSTSSSAAVVPTLASVAAEQGVRIGAGGLRPEDVRDEEVAALLRSQFTQITPGNALKLATVRPERDVWDFEAGDVLVDFADRNGIAVRGHTLVWGQTSGNGMRPWMRTLPPDELLAEMDESIATVMGRYRGRIERWDVVNEPFMTAGSELDPNPYFVAAGSGYIDRALRSAHAADPEAELWINEVATEYLPAKADALVALVTDLKRRGVPLDGVGLQTHLVVDLPIAPGTVGDLVRRLRALGVEVAITEMDVPIGPTRDLDAQTSIYRSVVDECVAAGCEEVTTWGASDRSTWLDREPTRRNVPSLSAFDVPSRPLLFDEQLQPKPAYHALVDLFET
jgi:endo-1,4-beta-xylanase